MSKRQKDNEPMSNTESGWQEFGAKKKATNKVDEIFGDATSGVKDADKGEDEKKEIGGNDLLSMMDDL